MEEWKRDGFLKRVYDKQYKKLLLVPIILLVLAFVQIGYQTATTGDFINKGVTLRGGTTFTLTADEIDLDSVDGVVLEQQLRSEFTNVDINVRTQMALGEKSGILVDVALFGEDVEPVRQALLDNLPGLSEDELDSNTAFIGSTLSQSFFRQTFTAVIIAFLLMGVVVFIYFRVAVPSIAVILAALSDIVVTIAVVNIFDIQLSTAGIAAFLMLIGYSVDTDILLSSRVLKHKHGEVFDRICNAMGTGLTMTLTTMAALLIALFLAQSPELKQIMIILLIGLVVDLINTWLQNAAILRWYLEKRRAHGKI